MRDACFVQLLHDVVCIWRPQVEVTRELGVRTPVYRLVAEAIPCMIQPASCRVLETVAGRVEQVTHTAYLEPVDLRPGDLLVERTSTATLAEAAHPGDEVVRVVGGSWVAVGDRLQIGAGETSELSLALSVDGGVIGIGAPLAAPHGQDEPVYRVVSYEVLGVADEAGAGHHLRVELRAMRS